MSYKIDSIHISFENNLKGKIALLCLGEVDAKINSLIRRAPFDILSAKPKSEDFEKLASERDRCFMHVLDLFSAEVCKQNNARMRRVITSVSICLIMLGAFSHSFNIKALKPSFPFSLTAIFVSCIATRILNTIVESCSKTLLINGFLNSIKIIGSQTQDCGICLEPLEKTAIATGHLVQGKIGHIFHAKCLEPLVFFKDYHFVHFCPLCRDEISFIKFKF